MDVDENKPKDALSKAPAKRNIKPKTKLDWTMIGHALEKELEAKGYNLAMYHRRPQYLQGAVSRIIIRKIVTDLLD